MLKISPIASGVVVCCPDQAQGLLVLGRGAVLEPEQVVGFQRLAQLRGLDRGHPVVPVVQQRDFRAELVPHRLEHGGQVAQVGPGVPVLLLRERAAPGRLVVVPLPGGLGLGRDAVDGLDAGDRGLDPDRLVAEFQVLADRVEERGQVRAGGVPVGAQPVPGRPAEELVDRHPGQLALDVPQRHVHRGDRGHRDRAAAPVRGPVQELPGVLDPVRVLADQQLRDVLLQIRGHRELPPVQRRVADPRHTILRGDPQGHEVPRRAGHKDFSSNDFHGLDGSFSRSWWASVGGGTSAVCPGPSKSWIRSRTKRIRQCRESPNMVRQSNRSLAFFKTGRHCRQKNPATTGSGCCGGGQSSWRSDLVIKLDALLFAMTPTRSTNVRRQSSWFQLKPRLQHGADREVFFDMYVVARERADFCRDRLANVDVWVRGERHAQGRRAVLCRLAQARSAPGV